MTGRFLGAAHNICNFRRQTNLLIPIYFHNLSRYDSHLMLTMISKFGDGNMKIIPSTEEEYISFSKIYSIGKRRFELRFLDSCRLMPDSLDELSSNLLLKDKTLFKNLLKFTSPEEQAVIFWNENIEANKTETIIDHNWNVKFNTFKTTAIKPVSYTHLTLPTKRIV